MKTLPALRKALTDLAIAHNNLDIATFNVVYGNGYTTMPKGFSKEYYSARNAANTAFQGALKVVKEARLENEAVTNNNIATYLNRALIVKINEMIKE